MDLQISSNGADISERWQQAPELTVKALTDAIWQAALLLEREVKEHTPVGVGGAAGLRGSIAARQPELFSFGAIGVVGTAAAHAVPVELGTRPHFPPLQPITTWVEKKLGIGGKEAARVAYAIARKIASKGTRPVGMFQQTFDDQRAFVEKLFERSLTDIRNELGTLS